jgi:ABC-type branched-subunit amino acid transport system substrate-binding protein
MLTGMEAAARVLNDSGHADVQLTWAWADAQCDGKRGLYSALTLASAVRADVIIGAPCSISSIAETDAMLFFRGPNAQGSAEGGLPVISYAATSPALSDKTMFPNFARTVGPNSLLAPLFSATMEKYAWNVASIVYANDGLYRPTATSFQAYFTANTPYTIASVHSFEPDTTDSTERLAIIESVRASGVRVVFLLAYCGDMRKYLLNALDTDNIRGYAYLSIDGTGECNVAEESDGRDADALTAMNGILTSTMAPPVGTFYDDFVAELQARRMELTAFVPPPSGPAPVVIAEDYLINPFNESYFVRPESEAPTDGPYSSFLHDAIVLYARALNHTLNTGQNHRDYRNIMSAFSAVTPFQGVSGMVVLDANGDRYPDGLLQYLYADTAAGETSLTLYDLGRFPAGGSSLAEFVPVANSSWSLDTLVWPGERAKAPVAQQDPIPACDASFMQPVVGRCDAARMQTPVSFGWKWELGTDDFVAGDDDLFVGLDPCSGGLSLPDQRFVDCSYAPIGSASASLAVALAVLALLLLLGTAVWIVLFRAHEIVSKVQPVMLMIFMLSSVAAACGGFTMPGPNSKTLCVARDVFYRLPLITALSAVVVRLRAGNRLMQGSKSAGRKQQQHLRVALETVAISAPYAIVMVVHESVATPAPEERVVSTSEFGEVSLPFCGTATLASAPTAALLFAYAALLCLYASFLATSAVGSVKLAATLWSLQGRTWDMKYTAAAVYLISAFVMLLHVTPSFVGDNAMLLVALQSLWLFLGAVLPVLVQWVPRMILVAMESWERSSGPSRSKNPHVTSSGSAVVAGAAAAAVASGGSAGSAGGVIPGRSRGAAKLELGLFGEGAMMEVPSPRPARTGSNGRSLRAPSQRESAASQSMMEMVARVGERRAAGRSIAEDDGQDSQGSGEEKVPGRSHKVFPIYTMIRDPARRERVLEVAHRMQCAELVLFAVDTRAYRKANFATVEEQFARYEAICHRYLTAGSDDEANLSGSMKKKSMEYVGRAADFAALDPDKRCKILSLAEAETLYLLSSDLMTAVSADAEGRSSSRPSSSSQASSGQHFTRTSSGQILRQSSFTAPGGRASPTSAGGQSSPTAAALRISPMATSSPISPRTASALALLPGVDKRTI